MIHFKGNDFTIDKYKKLCKNIIDKDYKVMTLEKYVDSQPKGKVAILRHDVDRRPMSALKMALIESSFNLTSTYYFRHMPFVYDKKIINKIIQLGHEIGYHYETLSKTHGNIAKAWDIFRSELSDFRELYNIKTISMHGRPLLPWDNKSLWEHFNYSDCGIIGEAYLSLDFKKIAYFSDTGRTWNSSRYNIRDRVHGMSQPEIETTDDLIEILRKDIFPQICIVTHPNRWSHSMAENFMGTTTDRLTNQLKKIFLLCRKKNN